MGLSCTHRRNLCVYMLPDGIYSGTECTHLRATLLLNMTRRFAVAHCLVVVEDDLFITEADGIPDTIKGTVELAIVDPPY